MASNKNLIEQMYGSNLESTKQQLTQDYKANVSSLDQQKAENEKTTQTKLNRTAVEAEKNRKNYNEVQNAYGLSSGAMAQARLAQDNQLQADMATIRAAQQTADQGIETEKNLLAQQFQSAISKAQADNDLQKAQALYELAQQEEEKLLEKQKTAASSMAAVGDYSLYGKLYGLTDDQTAALTAQYQKEQNEAVRQEELAKQEAAAEVMASIGDFSLYGQLYGLTAQQVAALETAYRAENGTASSGTSSGSSTSTSLTDDQIRQLQKAVGTTVDGVWGPQSQAAALKKYGYSDASKVYEMLNLTDMYDSIIEQELIKSGTKVSDPETQSYSVISNPEVWSGLVGLYGEEILKETGNVFRPAASSGADAAAWKYGLKNKG